MLSRLSLLLLLPALLPKVMPAEDHWIALKSGPFEVFSNAGERPAREKLMYLEQFRETLRVITGKEEMRMVWPVHVIIFKSAAEMPSIPKQWALARDARMAAITETGGFSTDSIKELARLLIYENTNRLPADIEKGLIELVSTVQIDGTRITLGAPVPEAERTPGWALIQLVTVKPDYAGRSSVLLSNLGQSGDFDAACHNAFEKTGAQIQQQADAYLKAGNFPTASISGRALSMTRDFKPVHFGSGRCRRRAGRSSATPAGTLPKPRRRTRPCMGRRRRKASRSWIWMLRRTKRPGARCRMLSTRAARAPGLGWSWAACGPIPTSSRRPAS